MDIVQIKAFEEDKAAFFEKLENFERDYDLGEGVSLLKVFPKDACFRMSDDFPDQIALFDFLPNVSNVLVASERVRALLESEGVDHVEYLPVQIVNHKGRKAKEKYFIINVFPRVDCADAKKSKFKRNPIDKNQWMEVSSLVIDDKRVPADFQLFGIEHIPSLFLVRRDLAGKMKAAGLRGFETAETSDYRR